MPFDGNPELWKLPQGPRGFSWMPFWMGFWATIVAGAVYGIIVTSWQHVKAPMIAVELQKTMRITDESGRSP